MKTFSHRANGGHRERILLNFSFFSVFFFVAMIWSAGCSIPNLESQNCTDARDAVKQLYSFHFGNDMNPTPENLKAREKFLTPEFYQRLISANSAVDPFTFAADPPKTFKIAKCTEGDVSHADLQVQIYWRDDQNTIQKEVHVSTIKTGEKWLINDVK